MRRVNEYGRVHLAAQVDAETADALEAVARREGRTMSSVIRRLIEQRVQIAAAPGDEPDAAKGAVKEPAGGRV